MDADGQTFGHLLAREPLLNPPQHLAFALREERLARGGIERQGAPRQRVNDDRVGRLEAPGAVEAERPADALAGVARQVEHAVQRIEARARGVAHAQRLAEVAVAPGGVLPHPAQEAELEQVFALQVLGVNPPQHLLLPDGAHDVRPAAEPQPQPLGKAAAADQAPLFAQVTQHGDRTFGPRIAERRAAVLLGRALLAGPVKGLAQQLFVQLAFGFPFHNPTAKNG